MTARAKLGLVFDLDGTLIDSAPAIMRVGNRLLDELGLAALDLPETRSFIGAGARIFVERALAARGMAPERIAEDVHGRFDDLYTLADPAENRPFPGVDAALLGFAKAGVELGLCTNKPAAPTRAVIEAMGWRDLFSATISGDSLPVRKPDPAPLRRAASDLDCAQVLYIGDSEVDAATAANAKLRFLLFTEGYRRTPIEELPHAAHFSDYAQLPKLVDLLTEECSHGA